MGGGTFLTVKYTNSSAKTIAANDYNYVEMSKVGNDDLTGYTNLGVYSFSSGLNSLSVKSVALQRVYLLNNTNASISVGAGDIVANFIYAKID